MAVLSAFISSAAMAGQSSRSGRRHQALMNPVRFGQLTIIFGHLTITDASLFCQDIAAGGLVLLLVKECWELHDLPVRCVQSDVTVLWQRFREETVNADINITLISPHGTACLWTLSCKHLASPLSRNIYILKVDLSSFSIMDCIKVDRWSLCFKIHFAQ